MIKRTSKFTTICFYHFYFFVRVVFDKNKNSHSIWTCFNEIQQQFPYIYDWWSPIPIRYRLMSKKYRKWTEFKIKSSKEVTEMWIAISYLSFHIFQFTFWWLHCHRVHLLVFKFDCDCSALLRKWNRILKWFLQFCFVNKYKNVINVFGLNR